MRKLKLALALTCALALCLALTGCLNKEVPKDAFLGTWYIYSIDNDVDDNAVITNGDVTLMQQMGMNSTMKFKDDDTVVLDLFGTTSNGTWEATGPKNATITMNETTFTVFINDQDHLVYPGETGRVVFSRETATPIGVDGQQDKDADDGDDTADDEASPGEATDDAAIEGEEQTDDTWYEEPAEDVYTEEYYDDTTYYDDTAYYDESAG